MTNIGADNRVRSISAADSRLAQANETWHVDVLATSNPPVAGILYAVELPSGAGGETQFADLSVVWRELSPDRRRNLLGKSGLHAFTAIGQRSGPDYPIEMVASYAPAQHPIVSPDPFSRLPIVLVGSHTRELHFEECGCLDIDGDTDAQRL